MVKIVTKVGDTYRYIDDTKNVLLSYEGALEAARRNGNTKKVRNILLLLTDLHISLHEYDKALQYSEEVLHLTRRTGPKRILREDLMRIGTILARLGRTHEADCFLREALSITRKIEDRLEIIKAIRS